MSALIEAIKNDQEQRALELLQKLMTFERKPQQMITKLCI